MKYKVIKEPELRNGEYGPYKLVTVEGPAGETHDNVLVGSKTRGYKDAYLGGTIDGDIDSSGRYPKFVFPRNAPANGRDYAAEEEARSKRIAFLASTERAIELFGIVHGKQADDMKDAEIRKFIFDWRTWFINQYNENT